MPSVRADHLLRCSALSHLSRHLNDASHRETYEYAHSMVLAIFAAQPSSTTVTEVQCSRPTFVDKIIPFYTRCLLQVCPDLLCSFFRGLLRMYDKHRTRKMANSLQHNFASHIAHLRAARVGMHRRWASSACPLSSRHWRAFLQRTMTRPNGDIDCAWFSCRHYLHCL